MTRFALEPIYGSLWFGLLAAAIVVLVIVLVTPPTKNPVHRRWLIVLRSIAAIALLLCALRPSLVRTDKKPAEATLIVAVDTSRSMTLPDTDNADRWTTQLDAWRGLASGLSKLDDALHVQLMTYDSDATPITAAAENALDSIQPDGDLTDLAIATQKSIQAAGGKPIAGIVFMGDGVQTAPIAGLSATQSAGSQNAGTQRNIETLNLLGVPFWPIPIGPSGGGSVSRDAAIDALPESFQLFAGNEVDVAFQLQTRGLAGIEVPVTLTWIDAAGKEDEAAERVLVPQRSSETQAFRVPMTVPKPGTYRLRVSAKKQSGELITNNNSQTAFVDVRAGGGRILYLYGSVRQEQSAIRRSLRRFPDLDLTYDWLRDDRTWPIKLDRIFDAGRFDIFVLDDVDAEALGEEQLEQLKEAVAEGAGLVMIGGYRAFGAGGYADSTLADAIPVKMDGSLSGRGRNRKPAGSEGAGQIAGPLKLELARRHPITDLGGSDPASVWKELPDMKGANRFVSTKVAPGIQVLLQSPKQQPLLVAGEFGKGRVVASALDSTWQWRRAGKSDVHRRFWRQLVLWLLGREDTSGDEIRIQLDARRFALDQPPKFRASIDSVGDQPAKVALVAEVIAADGTAIPVGTTADASAEGSAIRGKLPKLDAGFYALRVRPAEESSGVKAAEMAFQTIDESREMSRPMADPVYLQQLAQLTADHGGAAFAPDQIDELLETISQRRRKAEAPVVEKMRLGDGPVTGWFVFIVFALALGVEWFLRRHWGMA